MKTIERKKTYKPFWYPWAFEAFERQNQMHWIPTEISMFQDVNEYNALLSNRERSVINQLLRFFTQTDVEVARCYLDYYIPVFNNTEIRMMLISFGAMEAIHAWAYDYLLSSLRLPEELYEEFQQYAEMVEKYDYLQSFSMHDPQSIAKTLAIVSGGVEGIMLFSSFTVMMYFSACRPTRCLKGVGAVVSFSIRDESLHTSSILKLFHAYVEENAHVINKTHLEEEIISNIQTIVKHEFAFIDLMMKEGDLERLDKHSLKEFIKYLADIRIQQMGYKPIYGISANPLPWMGQFLGSIEMANFLEMEVTSYSKGFKNQDSEDAFGDVDTEPI